MIVLYLLAAFCVGFSAGVWVTVLYATRVYGKKLEALARHAAMRMQPSYALSE